MTEEIRTIKPGHGGAVEVAIRRSRAAATNPRGTETAESGRLPIVLVPGVGGPRETFYHQVEAFSSDRDVVATSLNPALAPGVEPIDSGARDVLAVLDSLNLAVVDLIGHSYGACVTARFTELYPQRVRRQIWIAPPVVHHAPWRKAFGPGWLFGGAIMKFSPPRYRGEVVRRIAASRTYSTEPDLTEQELAVLANRVSDTDFSPFFLRFSGLRDWDWRRLPMPAPRPTLVIQGEKEHRRTPRDVRRSLVLLSGGPIALTRGTHMPYLSYPDEFNAVVRDWLDAADDTS
jgi:pimeloyl-ACP methyl ester carboxylesterase